MGCLNLEKFWGWDTASCNVAHGHFLVLMWSLRRVVFIHHSLYFHPLCFMYKWFCQQVNWDTKAFLLAPFEPEEKKKYYSVMPCSSAKIIDYTSSIFVKIMHLSQLFFHMLTLKALRKLNVTDRYGSDLNQWTSIPNHRPMN